MTNSKISKIEKLDDVSLEGVSGGTVKDYFKTTGAIFTTVGFLGFGVCTIASSCCKNKNAKVAGYLDKAGTIFGGVAALGGAALVSTNMSLIPNK